MKQDSLLNTSFEIMTKSMLDGMRSSFRESSSMVPDSSYGEKFTKVIQSSLEASKEVARKVLNEELVRIYDSLFTQKEIDDFVGFYKTSSGQKMINSIPMIQKELVEIMAKKYTPQLQQDITNGILKAMNEEKKKDN